MDSPHKKLAFQKELVDWAIVNTISQRSLSGLLKTLKNYGHDHLPVDARTLLGTPRSAGDELKILEPGEYIHIGIEAGINYMREKYAAKEGIKLIKIDVSIDGVKVALYTKFECIFVTRYHVYNLFQMSKSTKKTMWPIWGMITEPFSSEPFLTAAYLSNHGKPSDFDEFVKYFVSELKTLNEKGICRDKTDFIALVNHDTIRVKLGRLRVDTPARNYLLGNLSEITIVLTEPIPIVNF